MSGKKQIRDLSCHKTKISLQAQENTKTIASGTKEHTISNSSIIKHRHKLVDRMLEQQTIVHYTITESLLCSNEKYPSREIYTYA